MVLLVNGVLICVVVSVFCEISDIDEVVVLWVFDGSVVVVLIGRDVGGVWKCLKLFGVGVGMGGSGVVLVCWVDVVLSVYIIDVIVIMYFIKLYFFVE